MPLLGMEIFILNNGCVGLEYILVQDSFLYSTLSLGRKKEKKGTIYVPSGLV